VPRWRMTPPTPLRTRPSRRYVALLALFGLLVLPAPPAPARATPLGPSPSPAIPAGDPATTRVATDASLHVWLRGLRRTRFVHGVAGHPFDEVWPSPDDDRWDHDRFDGLATPEALRSLSGPGTPLKNRRGAEVLAVAEAEGFGAGAPIDSPEDALLAMFTAWIEGEVRYEQQMRAFEAEHLPGGLRRSDLDEPDLIAFYRLPGVPRVDLRTSVSWPTSR
jgi:hypothetical protein